MAVPAKTIYMLQSELGFHVVNDITKEILNAVDSIEFLSLVTAQSKAAP